MASFLEPYRAPAILAPFLMLVEVAVDPLLPHLMERIIDVGIVVVSNASCRSRGMTHSE